MTLDELEQLFRKSRRTLWRYIKAGRIPRPILYFPFSWDERAVRDAHKKLREEATRKGKHQCR
jgi:predicted DNA-binding transcriptional regulator AlpA